MKSTTSSARARQPDKDEVNWMNRNRDNQAVMKNIREKQLKHFRTYHHLRDFETLRPTVML